MASDRWAQIEQLYHAALEHDAAERSHFLDRACAGDDTLRQEVESLLANDPLLAHDERAERFMDPQEAIELVAGILANGAERD